MKKIILLVLIFSCTALGSLPRTDQAQEKQKTGHDPIVEKVTVTNVEIPVRVLYKGKPITDLTKDDFTIYENKKKMQINGFFLKRKQINMTGTEEVIEKQKPTRPRTFVLVFSITDFNEHLKKAVAHLFENVLKTDDRILIFANDKTRKYPILKNKEEIQRQLLTSLKRESVKARHRLSLYINKVETYLEMHDFREEILQKRINRPDFRPEKLVTFLKKYLLTWVDYKKRYLTPRLERFYYFSRFLEEIKGDKWVLNFYQFDLFPKIRMTSHTMSIIREMATQLMNSKEAGAYSMGKMVYMILNQITMGFSVSKDFPTQEISKLFYKVDATFHSFFIRGMNKGGMGEMEYEEVASDIEKTLKQITDITGGQNITSNNLVESIETVSEIEDVYYILTYAPLDTEKTGKIKIKVNNKKYKLFYDDNFRVDYISAYLQELEEKIKTPDIKIENFSFQEKTLAFTVKDYLMKNFDKKTDKVGRMKVRIRVVDSSSNSMFDQAKLLTARKSEMKISLPIFKNITKGEYQFLIDATDLLTGKESNVHHDIIVNR